MKNINLKFLLNKIKENKFYYTIMTIYFILLLFQMKNVVMYADDFALKLISDAGWKNILQNQVVHYMTWGGGFTPLLVTVFLRGKFFFWKVFIALNIFLIVYLAIKMFNLKNDKERALCALFIWNCIFFVTIKISRETIYWLDGSMAYVFTTFQIFLYIYYIITRLIQNKEKKYDCILFPLIAFFAGWSSAQTGAIAFIIPTFIILYCIFIKKIKVKKFYKLVNLLGIIGFLIFYFSPGNSSRMEAMEVFSKLGFFDKILYRLEEVFKFLFDFKNVDFNSIPFFLLLFYSILGAFGIHYIKKQKQTKKKNLLLKISTISLILYIFNALCVFLEIPGYEYISQYTLEFTDVYKEPFTFKVFIQYGIHFWIIIASLINCFYIAKEENRDSIIINPFIMYFSQGIMVMAPYSEYRTTWIAVVFICVEIAHLFIILQRKKVNTLYLTFIPFLIFNVYIIVFILSSLLYEHYNASEKNYNQYRIVYIIFTFFALLNYMDAYDKYLTNRYIYEYNIETLKNYNRKDKEIYLYEPKYIYYGFGGLTGISYVEEPVKTMYNIDQDVEFKSITEEYKNEKN